MGRKILILPLSALVFALAGFLWASLSSPVWEARTALSLNSSEALAALPGMIAETGASAYAIPGTDVMEIALRAEAPEPALDRLDAALGTIPEFLAYLEISAEVSPLTTAARCLSQPQPGRSALIGAFLGTLAAILWTIPGPESREPMNLGLFLQELGRAFRRRLLPVCLTVLLWAGAGGLWHHFRAVPSCTATVLSRVGSYDPDTADGLAAAFLGLSDSQLAEHLADAGRVGKTNLFRLSSTSDKKTTALSTLDAALAGLPRLASHISGNPGLEILGTPVLSGPESPSLLKYMLLGGLIPAVLWLCLLVAEVRRKMYSCIP